MGRKRGKKERSTEAIVRDRHLLYSAAVQSVEADLDFFARVYRTANGRSFRLLREDFCGTAALACEWVRRNRNHRAWGVDLDRRTLDWGRRRYLNTLGAAANRIELIERNVLDPATEKVDAIAALNFSYSVFKTRAELGSYFARARESLRAGGILVLDCFGGTEAMSADREKRKIKSSKAFDGTRVPRFTYIWEQKSFNPIDHHIVCQIHFKLADGSRIRRAFRYDWRLWTLPELQELLLEAGFRDAQVYLEGWDDEADESDGIFRRRKRIENQSGWIAYVVGLC